MGVTAAPNSSNVFGQPALFRRSANGRGWDHSQILSTTPVRIVPDNLALEGEHLLVLGQPGTFDLRPFRLDPITDTWAPLPPVAIPLQPGANELGLNVQISGERAIVTQFSPGFPQSGSIHVCEFDAALGNWVFTESILSSPGDHAFALWSRIDGDTIISQAGGAAIDDSRLRVFERTPGGWVLAQTIEGSSFGSPAFFGASADVDGDRLVIVGGGVNALIFERAGPGVPFALASQFVDDGSLTCCLKDGAVVLGQSSAATVKIWREGPCPGTDWVRTHRLSTLNKHLGTPASQTQFGRSVDFDGEWLVVGAPGANYFGNREGAASVFRVPADINGDGIADVCQLATFEDVDGDGILDVAESPGSRFCSPNEPTVLGAPAQLLMEGSEFAEDNRLYMRMLGIPEGFFGLMLASRDFGFVPNAGGSNGNLCLTGRIGRRNGSISSLFFAQDDNVIVKQFDLSFSPTTVGVGMLAGETWYFQAWFRDGFSGSNFTDAMRVFLE